MPQVLCCASSIRVETSHYFVTHILKHGRHPFALLVPNPYRLLSFSAQFAISVSSPAIPSGLCPFCLSVLATIASSAPRKIDELYQSKKRFAGDRDLAVGVFITPQDAPNIIIRRDRQKTILFAVGSSRFGAHSRSHSHDAQTPWAGGPLSLRWQDCGSVIARCHACEKFRFNSQPFKTSPTITPSNIADSRNAVGSH